MVDNGVDPSQAAHSSGPTDSPLLSETISANLAATTARFGERDALVDVSQDRRWTYQQFRADVRRLATGLHDLGLRTGDRVGIWSPNRWEWTLVQYATAELGVILVNVNPAYRSHELEFVLQQSGIRAVIAAPSFKDSDYAGMLASARANCPELEFVVLFGDEVWQRICTVAVDDQLLDGIQAGLSPTDPINIQYTSGTTGFPKGATLSHTNILNNGFFVGELLHYSEVDRVCIPVPFYHCFGMVMGNLASTSHGSCMVIPAPAFDPKATLAAVSQEKCTSLYGVPTMFIAELALEDFDSYDLSSLRTGVMAGSPCPEQVMRATIERMHMSEVSICYGMTETSPVSTQTRTDDSLQRRVGTSDGSGRIWRSRSSTRSPATPAHATSPANCAPRATA